MSKKTTQQSIAAMKERIIKDLSMLRTTFNTYRQEEALRTLGPLEGAAAADAALALAERQHTQEEALVSVETALAVFLQLASASRPSVVASAMRTVEIRARMDGKHVFE